VAQKKSFNRLVIGVAADFAGLRRPSSSTTESAQARPQVSAPQTPPVAVNLPPLPVNLSTANNLTNVIASLQQINLPAVDVSSGLISDGPTVFRGRTIWPDFP